MSCCCVLWVVVAYVIYKLIDRLLRLPRVGRNSDRYIFVTGCDTGFGNLLVKRLDHLGCHVFAGCLTEKGETELRKSCSDRLHTVPLDVSKKESVQRAFDQVRSKLPTGKGLWGVVNNAGLIQKLGPNDWLNADDFRSLCDINLFGLIDVALTFLPLVKMEKGRVVNMSSGAGRCAVPFSATYCVSKYGVEAFTDGLRRDLRPFGCKAVIIEPGGFKTPGSAKEVFSQGFSKAWDTAPSEVKQQYGEEYLHHLMTVFCEKLTETMSDRVDKVVAAYESALLSRYPRARYPVGMGVFSVFVFMQMLPESLNDWIWELFHKSFPQKAFLRK